VPVSAVCMEFLVDMRENNKKKKRLLEEKEAD
jgi:hypothetical protein